jgi:predicted transcriptional regulator
MLALRLPAEIEQRLDALAKKTGRSKSYYAREAILRQIEASATCARRVARDARNPGAAAQETHQAVTTAPVWKIGGTASDPFKVEAGD